MMAQRYPNDYESHRHQPVGNVVIRYFFAQNKDFNPLGFHPATYSARIDAVSNIMDATIPISARSRRMAAS